MIQRLEPNDPLLREAFSWTKDTPEWHRQMDSVFSPGNIDDFLTMMAENILVGVFDLELIGVIIIAPAGRDVFNAHLCAKRGAQIEVLAAGAVQVVSDFLNMGMKEGFCWVAEKNVAVRKLCSTIGMTHEGVVMYRGVYRSRVIKWLRYAIRAEAGAVEIAA